jgi:hypothetical protein
MQHAGPEGFFYFLLHAVRLSERSRAPVLILRRPFVIVAVSSFHLY